MLRLAVRRALHPRLTRTPVQACVTARFLCDDISKSASGHKLGSDSSLTTEQPKGNSIFNRLVGSPEGRNPFLVALGYYSRESVALGAGNELYTQLRARAEDAVRTLRCEKDEKIPFPLRFEMLSVHVYLSIRRIRHEKGSKAESDCVTMMQCLFDVFWTDVRNRMLIEEEGMTLIPSGKWVKECEKMFFGMALAFDESWDNRPEFEAAAKRNITSLKTDANVRAFVDYMFKERARLDNIPIERILEQKETWSPTFELRKRAN